MAQVARLLLFFFALIGLLPRAVPADEPILIGWVGPLSPPGNYSAGPAMRWAVEMQADEINKAVAAFSDGRLQGRLRGYQRPARRWNRCGCAPDHRGPRRPG